MFRGWYRGMAVAGLAAALCVPALAQGTTGGGAGSFTPSQHLMHDILASHYGLTHQQVMDLHARGYSYEDIATAANIAARSGRPMSEIIAMRDRRMEWVAIGSQYGIAEADLNRPYVRVAGARGEMGGARPSGMAGHSKYAMPNTNINWSRTYELTPLEMRRLRAKGLSDREIFLVANAAMLTGKDVDHFVQELFRGRTARQIAEQYNLRVSDLERVDPMWQSPEWETAVKEGHYFSPSRPGMSSGSSGSMEGTRR